MGWWGRMRGRAPQREAATQPRVFHSTPVADVIAALTSQTGPVTRDEALSVPAIVRARNEICAIATLPLRCYDSGHNVVDRPLLRQYDMNVPNVVHLSQTIEDLLFYGISWWKVEGYGWDGFPASVRRVDPGSVSVSPPFNRSLSPLPSGVDPRGGVVYVDGLPVAGADMIRFDSPNPGLLTVGARTIRTAIALDRAARLFADQPPAREVLSPADGQDLDQTEIDATLADYQARSKAGVTRWLPSTVKREEAAGYSPGELQLVEMKRQNVLELANLTGLDPEELGLSTTSRTYKNINERRIDKVNEVLAPYLSAITDRLNMRSNVFPATLTAAWDLTDYQKADALDRATVQKIYLDAGVLDPQEVREAERIPGRAPGKPEPPAPTVPPGTVPDPQEANVDASREPTHVFAEARVQFVDLDLQTFSVDTESRTITGIAVPYGSKQGNGYRFERGALTWKDMSRVKLNIGHDRARAVGKALAINDRPSGLEVKFTLPKTSAGDDALVLASEGVLDGLSIEAIFDDLRDTVPDPRHKNGRLVKRAELTGAALTGDPAFEDARVTRVAMMKEDTVSDTENPAPATEPTPATVPANPATTAANTSPVAAQFTAEEVERLRNFAAMVTESGRAVVNPTTRPVVVTQVQEPASYRFDRQGTLLPAAFDFATDLIAAAKFGRPDAPEYKRVMEFMTRNLVFNVATGDVNELNPTITQPRFIDEREFQYPLFAATNRGAPPNGVQPFKYPVFSSSTGLLAAHEEGTEPDTGTYVTTDHATITPAAYSGKARVNREVWDMGGQPGLSDLVWRKITRTWFETIEGVIEDVLTAASPTSLGTFTAGGGTDGRTLVAELRRYLGALQFVRGGFRFTDLFAEYGFYNDLQGALDTTGRPIFPAMAPQNADGTVAGQFATISVNGTPVRPTWALGATSSGTNAASSYLIDRSSVDSWTTGPQRLDFTNVAVSYVDIGVWGYMAATINDLAGVREVIYAETS